MPYDFVSGVHPIATDCSILMYTCWDSESFFDGLISVPLAASNEAEATMTGAERAERETSEEDVKELRQLFTMAREGKGGVQLHPKLHEVAVSDFVQKRQLDDDISCESGAARRIAATSTWERGCSSTLLKALPP